MKYTIHETLEHRDLIMKDTLSHVRGRVTDINGNGLRRSRVSIVENGRSAFTDPNGNFELIDISPGMYTLIAESEEYPVSILADVIVECGDNTGHMFVMYSRNADDGHENRRTLAGNFA
jgi:hypothetical protein